MQPHACQSSLFRSFAAAWSRACHSARSQKANEPWITDIDNPYAPEKQVSGIGLLRHASEIAGYITKIRSAID